MSSTITAVSAAPAPSVAPAGAALAGGVQAQPSGPSASSTAQQQAALNRLLVQYTNDQSRNVDAATVAALGKKITAAAKALGQHVTLPHAPAGAATGSAQPTERGASEKGLVNLTA